MKKHLLFLSVLLVTLITIYSCTPGDGVGMFGDSYSQAGGSGGSGDSEGSGGLTGVWYAPGCGTSKGHTLILSGSATSGTGSLSSIDCAGICGPIVLKFSYTISGSTMIWNFDASQPIVHCSGYADSRPKTPASSSHSISGVSANSFTLDSQVFNR